MAGSGSCATWCAAYELWAPEWAYAGAAWTAWEPPTLSDTPVWSASSGWTSWMSWAVTPDRPRAARVAFGSRAKSFCVAGSRSMSSRNSISDERESTAVHLRRRGPGARAGTGRGTGRARPVGGRAGRVRTARSVHRAEVVRDVEVVEAVGVEAVVCLVGVVAVARAVRRVVAVGAVVAVRRVVAVGVRRAVVERVGRGLVVTVVPDVAQ